MGEVLGSGVGVGTEGLVEGPEQARAGGGGCPYQAAPGPRGLTHAICPHHPVRKPSQCTCCGHKWSQGPHAAETLGRASPTPSPPGWGERGLADSSSFSYSFNFCLLLKGAQSSGPKSLGSILESAAGGSFSLPHLHSTPTSLGAGQDTTEGRKPHLALTCSPRTGLRHCTGHLPSGASVFPLVGRMGGAGLVISGVWLSREATSPTPLAPEPLNVDCLDPQSLWRWPSPNPCFADRKTEA